MRYVSVFSGIEAASCAWGGLGWEPVAFSEIEPFPCAVLQERFPGVPNLGDITKVDWSGYRGAVDVVVGGSPCQSFSLAGKREGLRGASGLMFEYVRAVSEILPEWVVWENVPGALSSTGGEDFGCLLRSLDDLGYGLAWRVLDAQFFGVAQRRRRLFLVGHLGDMRACDVLFEQESLRWDTPTSAEQRQAIASAAREGAGRAVGDGHVTPLGALSARPGAKQRCYVCQTQYGDEMAGTLTARHDSSPCADRGQNVVAVDFRHGTVSDPDEAAGTLQAKSTGGYSLNYQPGVMCMTGDNGRAPVDEELCGTLARRHEGPSVAAGTVVRRLTPLECERLMGFPDGWTDIPYKGRPHPADGPRYKALGNSMAVPVMRWIGERIAMEARQ